MTGEQWPPHSGVPSKSRFKKAKTLRWGETPFDNLTRAELLRLVQAYHSALTSARSIMLMAKARAPDHPFYGKDGSAGRALAKAEYLFVLCGDGGANKASEEIYRSFFRTADVLMFPYLRGDDFSDWGINDKGEMVAPFRGEDSDYRRIEWPDVCPLDEAAAEEYRKRQEKV